MPTDADGRKCAEEAKACMSAQVEEEVGMGRGGGKCDWREKGGGEGEEEEEEVEEPNGLGEICCVGLAWCLGCRMWVELRRRESVSE